MKFSAIFEISEDWFTIIFKRPQLQKRGDVIEGVSGGVNSLLEYIQKNSGLRVIHFVKALEVPTRTVERWLKQFKEEEKIEFRGSPKKGGYWVK